MSLLGPIQGLVDLDQVSIRVSEVGGANSPTGIIGRFRLELATFTDQLESGPVYIWNFKNQRSRVFASGFERKIALADRIGHGGASEQGDGRASRLKISVSSVFITPHGLEPKDISIEPETCIEVSDEKANVCEFDIQKVHLTG